MIQSIVKYFVGIIIATIISIGIFFAGIYFMYQRFQPTTLTAFESRKNEINNLIKDKFVLTKENIADTDTAQLKGIVNGLEDQYSAYLSKDEYKQFKDSIDERFEGIGIRFSSKESGYTITKVLENSPAQNAGLMAEDILTKVNNEDITNLDQQEIITKIRGKAGTKVTIMVVRGSETKSFEIERKSIENETVTLETKDQVGIITISSFGTNVGKKIGEISKKIRTNPDIKYLLLDIRSNTGGLLNEAVEVASYFQKPDTDVVKEEYKNDQETLKTNQNENSLEAYPLVVVTDKSSASASEILAGSLRDNRGVKIVGEKTFGKGVVQSLFQLSNGDMLKITTAKWLTPKGTQIHEKGLSPDVRVLKADDVLPKAIEEVKK
jgi:carboxyl-terminal processing protease